MDKETTKEFEHLFASQVMNIFPSLPYIHQDWSILLGRDGFIKGQVWVIAPVKRNWILNIFYYINNCLFTLKILLNFFEKILQYPGRGWLVPPLLLGQQKEKISLLPKKHPSPLVDKKLSPWLGRQKDVCGRSILQQREYATWAEGQKNQHERKEKARF